MLIVSQGWQVEFYNLLKSLQGKIGAFKGEMTLVTLIHLIEN